MRSKNASNKKEVLHAHLMGCYENMSVINSTLHLKAHIYQPVERPTGKSGISQYFPSELYLMTRGLAFPIKVDMIKDENISILQNCRLEVVVRIRSDLKYD